MCWATYCKAGRPTKFALAGKWNRCAVKYLLRKCEMFACANVGKFHFTSNEVRYFTMCVSTLFHVLLGKTFHLYLPPEIQNITHYTLQARHMKRSTNKIDRTPFVFSVGKTCFMESTLSASFFALFNFCGYFSPPSYTISLMHEAYKTK